MSARPKREPWTWPERAAYWLYGFFLGPFLKTHPNGTVTGEVTYWIAVAFAAVEVLRLMPRVQPDGTWFIPHLSTQEVFMVFFILYVAPIDGGLTKAAPDRIVDLVSGPFARAGDAIDAGAEVTTTLKQQITPEPLGVSGDQR